MDWREKYVEILISKIIAHYKAIVLSAFAIVFIMMAFWRKNRNKFLTNADEGFYFHAFILTGRN